MNMHKLLLSLLASIALASAVQAQPTNPSTLNNISGILSSAKGGTGITSYTTGDMLYATGTTTLSKLGTGNNSILQTNNTGVPSFSTTPFLNVATATSLFAGNTTNWISTYAYGTNGTAIVAQAVSGSVGITGASRNIDNAGGVAASIGVLGWNFNFNTTTPAGGWGLYGETRRIAGTGPSVALELNATEFGAAGTNQPFNIFAATTAGAWIASGGNCTSTTPCWTPAGPGTGVAQSASVAVAIITNGSNFLKGIVFKSDALSGSTGTDGDTGVSTAIALARNQRAVWYASDGTDKAWLYSTVSTSGTTQKLRFSDFGLLYENSFGATMFQVDTAAAYRNGIIITPGGAGVSPIISPKANADTNLNLVLTGLGTGGVFINGAVTATGSVATSSPTAGIGYSTGAGGAVTQITSKATGVTLNKTTGNITMAADALLASTAVSFTLTNSTITATDALIINHISGGTAGAYLVSYAPAAGSATITIRNVSLSSLSEAPVLKFGLFKSVVN